MKKLMKKYLFLPVITFLLFSSISGCSLKKTKVSAEPLTDTRFLLDTVVTIKLYDTKDTKILERCFELIEEYENLLSRTKESSEVYQFNHRTKNIPFPLSNETAALLKIALSYCERSHGAFDVSIAPISSLWDFKQDSTKNPTLPNPSIIKEKISLVDYQNLHLKGTILTADKLENELDLGAIAKGYIADKIKEYLQSEHINSALINLGGNVLCVGQKPDGTPFGIGIQKPFETYSETVDTVYMNDMSVVSSGIYERYIKVDHKLYHHILNPKTGYPYETDLMAVTILSKKSVDGDGLSTTCFALGLDKGTELIESLDDTYALFITNDGTLHYTKGFKQFLKK